MDINQQLYKFRGGDITIFNRDLQSLSENYFWAAEISSLNDPCEALVKSETYFHQLNTFQQVIHQAIDSSISFDDIRSKMNNLLVKAREMGIFSLSKNYDDELMWSHYAAAHHGFCVGYNLYFLERSLEKYFYNLLEVVYSAHPPEIKMMEQIASRDSLLGMKQLIATKSLRWKNEEEIRIVTEKIGRHAYDYRSVESIYFGLRMKTNQRNQVMEQLKGRGIKYYEMNMAKSEYKFYASPIDDKFFNAEKYMYSLSPVLENIVNEEDVNDVFKPFITYLYKAIAVARREPYCTQVIDCGFTPNSTKDKPVIYVMCGRTDGGVNYEYDLQLVDFFYGKIEDL